MAANPKLEVGHQLAEYTLEAPLGEGGMAVTWRARERVGDMGERIVAIKTIKPERAQESTFRDMFFDEMRITALINHRNVCQIHRAGEVDGVLFMAMEFIDGWPVSSLRKRFEAAQGVEASVESSMWDFRPHEVRRLGFPVAPALWIAAETAAGLAAAHELVDADGRQLHVVHRDVSPQNVMVASTGAVKLIDFGVAKANTNLVRTETGLLKGKVPYMSHEQLEGLPLDGRSDLFSLGLMLYELLTGIHPLLGSTDAATMFNYATRTIAPPSEVLPEIPPQVDAVVMGALERNRDLRWQSGHDLGRALVDALQVVHPGYREPHFAAWLQSLNGRSAAPDAFAATGFIETPGPLHRGSGVTPAPHHGVGTSPTAATAAPAASPDSGASPQHPVGPSAHLATAPDLVTSPGTAAASGVRSWVTMVVILLVVLFLGLVALIVLMAKGSGETEPPTPATESAETDGKDPTAQVPVAPQAVPTTVSDVAAEPSTPQEVIGVFVDNPPDVPPQAPDSLSAVDDHSPDVIGPTETQLFQLKESIIPCFDLHSLSFDQAAAFLEKQSSVAIDTCAEAALGWFNTSPVRCTVLSGADHVDLRKIRGKLMTLEDQAATAHAAVQERKAYWEDASNHTCSNGTFLTATALDALNRYLDTRNEIAAEIAAWDDKLDARRRRTLLRAGGDSFELYLRSVASALEAYMSAHPALGKGVKGRNQKMRARQEKVLEAVGALDEFCGRTPIDPDDSLACRKWALWSESTASGLEMVTEKVETGSHSGNGAGNPGYSKLRSLPAIFDAKRVPVNVFWRYD